MIVLLHYTYYKQQIEVWRHYAVPNIFSQNYVIITRCCNVHNFVMLKLLYIYPRIQHAAHNKKQTDFSFQKFLQKLSTINNWTERQKENWKEIQCFAVAMKKKKTALE